MNRLSEDERRNIVDTCDSEIIKVIDVDNLFKIYKYLIDNGIYFARDLIVDYLDIFVLDYDCFVTRFEELKKKLGSNYIEVLENDISNLEELC